MKTTNIASGFHFCPVEDGPRLFISRLLFGDNFLARAKLSRYGVMESQNKNHPRMSG